jgi:hypothetical protein
MLVPTWTQALHRSFTELRSVDLEGPRQRAASASTCGDKHLAGWWDLATFILEHGRMTRLPLLPRPFLGAIDQPLGDSDEAVWEATALLPSSGLRPRRD